MEENKVDVFANSCQPFLDMTTQINTKILYNADFLLWLETTANVLKTRQLEQLDYDNLQ